jgi:hypothetical protein
MNSSLWAENLGQNQVLNHQYWMGFLTHRPHEKHRDGDRRGCVLKGVVSRGDRNVKQRSKGERTIA